MKAKCYMLMILVSALLLVSCGENDFDGKDNQPWGLLASKGSLYDMEYDEKGRLSSCKYVYTLETIEFEYYADYVSIKYGCFQEKTAIAYLGKNGYINKLEVQKGVLFVATFEYNADGYVVAVNTVGENTDASYQITYDGAYNIMAISLVSNYHFKYNGEPTVSTTEKKYELQYTDDDQIRPIRNRSGLSVIDDFIYNGEYYNFPSQYIPPYMALSRQYFTEWVSLYYAGLLGKGTAYLPVKIVELGTENFSEFEWMLDDDGRPQYVKITFQYKNSKGYWTSSLLWM